MRKEQIGFCLLKIARSYYDDLDMIYFDCLIKSFLGIKDYQITNKTIKQLVESNTNETDQFYQIQEYLSIVGLRLSEVNSIFWKIHRDDWYRALVFLYQIGIDFSYILNEPKLIKKGKFVISLSPNKIRFSQCALCTDNIGDIARLKRHFYPIFLKLGGEEFLLHSPVYPYFEHHYILASKEHTPHKIDRYTIRKMHDFLVLFPKAFISINSPKKYVGGSILEHEHMQAGVFDMPIFSVPYAYSIDCPNYQIGILDYPAITIKIKSDFFTVDSLYALFLTEIHELDNDNSLSMFLKLEDDKFALYMVIRSSKTNELFPDGIYTTPSNLHHIKKDGIGIMELMGLFVLPEAASNLATEDALMIMLESLNPYDINFIKGLIAKINGLFLAFS